MFVWHTLIISNETPGGRIRYTTPLNPEQRSEDACPIKGIDQYGVSLAFRGPRGELSESQAEGDRHQRKGR